MLITDRFVMLNYPRTGSTFARDAVQELYARQAGPIRRLAVRLRLAAPPLRELWLPIDRTLSAERLQRRSQHAVWSQIPPGDRSKTVLSITRSPFDRAVSMFEHRFWLGSPPADEAELKARFPSYPDLAFDAYLDMMNEFGLRDVLKGRDIAADVGPQTIHFLKFYAREPERALDELRNPEPDLDHLRSLLAEVRFIHTEDLGVELRSALMDLGLDDESTRFILDLKKSNIAAKREGRGWREYFTPELEAAFRHKERFLFHVFPEYAG